VSAAFPHGFGLSYTTFDLRRASVNALSEDSATLTVEVANSGTRDGGHVVQVYGRARTGPYAGERMLVGFVPVFVPVASTVSVAVPVSLWPLATWDASSRRRELPVTSDVELEVGSHAHDPEARHLRLGPIDD
jgi:beta-glucosidase